ncbi:MAG: hypothetical protein ACLUQ6_02570 [Alistipes onderdonkii]
MPGGSQRNTWYTVGEFSWPWLILGNGFSHDVWLVQWYEYTGVFGGSLWVLLCNILFFEALRARRSIGRWIPAAGVLLLPAAVSLGIWWSWEQPDEGTAEVSVVQPNVDCYDKFNGRADWQQDNITDLLAQVPTGAQFILLPETAVPGHYWEPDLSEFRPADGTGHVLARAGRQPAPVAPRGPARHGRQHPALLCRRGTTPHGTPGRVGRRLLRCIQHGGRARLRRPHTTAPQRQNW